MRSNSISCSQLRKNHKLPWLLCINESCKRTHWEKGLNTRLLRHFLLKSLKPNLHHLLLQSKFLTKWCKHWRGISWFSSAFVFTWITMPIHCLLIKEWRGGLYLLSNNSFWWQLPSRINLRRAFFSSWDDHQANKVSICCLILHPSQKQLNSSGFTCIHSGVFVDSSLGDSLIHSPSFSCWH